MERHDSDHGARGLPCALGNIGGTVFGPQSGVAPGGTVAAIPHRVVANKQATRPWPPPLRCLRAVRTAHPGNPGAELRTRKLPN